MAPKHRRIRILETKQDFFENIPPEIMIDILSRLPIPTVISCKCVCKSWLNLLESHEFANSHFSKSVPGLALDEYRPLTLALFRGEKGLKPYKILELVDTQNSGHQFYVVFKLNFPHRKLILHCSANGLLLMLNKMIHNLFICNPITREYIKLPPPPPVEVSSIHEAFGFGVSNLTGKYKVVRLFRDSSFDRLDWPQDQLKCEVYTLGTGSWRSVASPGGPLQYSITSLGVLLNGNLHWLVRDVKLGGSSRRILYFDLETECFSTFSILHHDYPFFSGVRTLCALGDSLCLCYKSIAGDVFDIWLMKKYGDDKSWRKEFVIKKHHFETVVPIKMFKNGDIMFASHYHPKLYCYSSETKTMLEVDQTKAFDDCGFKPIIYVPSFLPLKTFAMENVSSF